MAERGRAEKAVVREVVRAAAVGSFLGWWGGWEAQVVARAVDFRTG